MRLSAIHIYPIKSLGGITRETARVEPRGLAFDRRWMLVDEEGLFLTQRDIPEMALLQPDLTAGALRVHHRRQDRPALVVNLPPYDAMPLLQVQVWEDQVAAQLVDPEADSWFSKALGVSCRLVFLPDQSRRPVDSDYAQPGEHVSFADGYPFLITGTASLEDLNRRLADPVPMNRFRPNLVFEGGLPYEEESWTSFRIGEVKFRGAKICGRCQITTIDQETGQTGKEPLRTLAAYRRQGNKVPFGLNACLTEGAGEMLRIGQPLEVFQKKMHL